jgi:hypothetical protein
VERAIGDVLASTKRPFAARQAGDGLVPHRACTAANWSAGVKPRRTRAVSSQCSMVEPACAAGNGVNYWIGWENPGL